MGIKSNRKRKENVENTLWMLLFLFSISIYLIPPPLHCTIPFHPNNNKKKSSSSSHKTVERQEIDGIWGLLRFITSQSIWNERNHKKILFQHRTDKKEREISSKQCIRTDDCEGETELEKLLNDSNTSFFFLCLTLKKIMILMLRVLSIQ